MWTRQLPSGRFIKNPSGCCFSWSPHNGRVVGDCYHTANADWRELAAHEQKLCGNAGLPTKDDHERWDIFLKLRDSVEQLQEAEK